MRIAIDFDETLTLDAGLWRGFIDACRAVGHHVICVTARRDTDENHTYFTGLGSKVEFMKAREIKVDVWIDDDPKKCALGH